MLRLAAVTKATVVAGHHYRTAVGLSKWTPKFPHDRSRPISFSEIHGSCTDKLDEASLEHPAAVSEDEVVEIPPNDMNRLV